MTMTTRMMRRKRKIPSPRKLLRKLLRPRKPLPRPRKRLRKMRMTMNIIRITITIFIVLRVQDSILIFHISILISRFNITIGDI